MATDNSNISHYCHQGLSPKCPKCPIVEIYIFRE